MEELFQVNITETVDGNVDVWISRYSDDGYVGILTDTAYEDGDDRTNWCVFFGTKSECESWVKNHPNATLFG